MPVDITWRDFQHWLLHVRDPLIVPWVSRSLQTSPADLAIQLVAVGLVAQPCPAEWQVPARAAAVLQDPGDVAAIIEMSGHGLRMAARAMAELLGLCGRLAGPDDDWAVYDLAGSAVEAFFRVACHDAEPLPASEARRIALAILADPHIRN